jgi:hypothetical protein
MKVVVEPFAVELWRRYQMGLCIQALSAETGISADRIVMRIRAAERFLGDQKQSSGTTDTPPPSPFGCGSATRKC